MRKNILLLLLVFIAVQTGFAAPRSFKQARAIAMRKAASLGIVNPNASFSKQSPGGSEDAEGKAYYMFDNGGDRGFVIVSGDDRLQEVIGYSTQGSLSEGTMPIQLKSLLDAFEKEYDKLVGDDQMMECATAERKALAQSFLSANVNVAPLLGDIQWGQSTPFNNLCPTSGGSHCVTGCVATAMAQVIGYFKYPTKLQQDIPSYTNGLTLGVISASSAPNYDYSHMLGSYSSYSDTEASAVATLMYHCGCAVQMNYGIYGSSAISNSVHYALGKYFGYDTNTLAYVNRRDYSLEDWCGIIDHELSNRRPVIYDGRTSSDEGHAFICDGADGNGFYHINWGWDGSYNGYFDISLLNNNYEGNTTGEGGFNISNSMTIGIRPTGSVTSAPKVKGKDLYAKCSSSSLTQSTRTNATETFKGSSSITISNMSFNKFSGWVALAVANGSGYDLISLQTNVFSLDAITLMGGFQITSRSLNFEYEFPIGTTKVYVVYGNGKSVISACGAYDGNPYFYVTATATSAQISKGYSLSATLTADDTIYKGIDNDLTLTVTNSGVSEYLDNVKIYTSNTGSKPSSATTTMALTVPANNGSTTRKVTVKPSVQGDLYVWVDDAYGNALISAQKFTVLANEEPVLTLESVESNAMAGRYETNDAYIKYRGTTYKVMAPKTFDDSATFTFKMKSSGGVTTCKALLQCWRYDDEGTVVEKQISKRINRDQTETFSITVSPQEVGSRFIKCVIFIYTNGSLTNPTVSESFKELEIYTVDHTGYFTLHNGSAVYVPETTEHNTNLGNNSTYWATYSNQAADTELGVETGRELTLYNVTVENGQMTLAPRTGDYAYKVAKGEAVLVKTDGASVKVDDIGTGNGLTIQRGNDLKATPAEAQSIQAGEDNVFYRLTYDNKENKTNLGFYKAVATVGGTKYTDGSWINATPNKGYLDITKTAATQSLSVSPVKGFVIDGDDNTTAIDDIFDTDIDKDEDNSPLYNLQGQQVKNVGKGVFIKKNKKVIIK